MPVDHSHVGRRICASGQSQVPEIPFVAVDALSDFPDDIHLGEAAGVARNSDGEIFVYTRTGKPGHNDRRVPRGVTWRLSTVPVRLGRRIRTEIGQDIYGALYAQQVRVDRDDNIWTVDQMSGQVIKFDPAGRIQMVMSRKPEAMRVPAPPPPEEAPSGEGREGESFRRPTDVAWDSQGNFYVADGIGNSRVAKYEPTGRWIMNWGRRALDRASSTFSMALPSIRRTTSTSQTIRTNGSRYSTQWGTSRWR